MTSIGTSRGDSKLAQIPGTFFSTEAAAQQLGVDIGIARELLTGMQRSDRSVRVCRDGWVLTLRHREDPVPPILGAYVHDMMRYLGVGYYISYPAAAELRGAAHHGVLLQRTNVETHDIDALELRDAIGPADLGVAFHQIDPQHGRAATLMDRSCWCPTGDGRGVTETRTIRVATIETALLDMVERSDRCGGMDHAATIAVKALFWRRLDPVLLADASDRYALQVARRAGSMLQQIRGFQHRFNLRPLLRRVRSRPVGLGGPPVEMYSREIDTSRKADRWGVTYRRRLDPDL